VDTRRVRIVVADNRKMHFMNLGNSMLFRAAHMAWALVVCLMLGTSVGARAGEPDIAAINSMDRVAFVQRFGGIFEKSPWVADQVWSKRPFASVDQMHLAMVNIVKYAPLPSLHCCRPTRTWPASKRRPVP
jgi:hypothetical protein